MSEPTSAERKVRSADSLAQRVFDITFAAVVLTFGDALARSLDLLAKAGAAHPTRWLGAALLVALVMEPCGLALSPWPHAKMRPEPPWFDWFLFYVVAARFILGLMLLVLGLTGLGIEVRDAPPPSVILLMMLSVAAREAFFVLRVARRGPQALVQRSPFARALVARACTLPAFVLAHALIEGSLLRQTFGVTPDGFASEALGVQLAWSAAGVAMIGVLYFLLLFAPLRLPAFVADLRECRVRGVLTSFTLGLGVVAGKLIVPWFGLSL